MKRTLEKNKTFLWKSADPDQADCHNDRFGFSFRGFLSHLFYKTSSTLILDNSRHYIQNTIEPDWQKY